MSSAKSPARKAMKQLQANSAVKRSLKNKNVIQKMIENMVEKKVDKKEKAEEEKDWLTRDDINSVDKYNYWKEVAQEREIVLEKTLKENRIEHNCTSPQEFICQLI